MGDNESKKSGGRGVDGDIEPPRNKRASEAPPPPPNIYADNAAQINQYTDRPDLFLEAIERYDPGFIKSMNDEARTYARRYRESRFHFGRIQAYLGLFVAVVAALTVLYVLYVLAENGNIDFLNVIALGVFFAISQSGASGFMKIVTQVVELIKNARG